MEEQEVKWKVIYVASKQEKKVSAYLDKAGVTHYLPLYRSLRFGKTVKNGSICPYLTDICLFFRMN